MKLIDTHAHLYYDRYDQDRRELLERTWETLDAVICIGADLKSSQQSIDQAATDPRIFATVGIHPHVNEPPDQLKKLAANPKVVAIGECGLDYKPYLGTPVDKAAQQRSLWTQIELANELDLPVIIHARDCWEDLVPLLKKIPPQSGVIHSFTGGLKQANELINLGLYLSFSGMITYPANEHIREVARMVPLELIVVETDAPYLPPQSLRGQRNEPAFVKMTAEKIAEVRRVSLDEIATATTQNAISLFRLPL